MWKRSRLDREPTEIVVPAGPIESLHDQFASPCASFPCDCSGPCAGDVRRKGPSCALAAPYERSLSVIMARGCDGGFQELPHELLRSATVSSTLDHDVENEAILIDGAPQPVRLASNRDDPPHPYAICRREQTRAVGSDRRTPCRLLPHSRTVSFITQIPRQKRSSPSSR